MTDPIPSASPENPNVDLKPPRSRGWRWLVIAAVTGVAVVTGAAATRAFEHGPFWRPGTFVGPMTPAMIEDRADRMIRHLAIEVDATAEQQEKLRTIVRNAVRDLLPLREKAQANRERGRALLTQPTIDRTAIEAFRAEQITFADQASRRIAQALGDAAEVLTVEQRRKIDDRISMWRSRFGGPRGWHHD